MSDAEKAAEVPTPTAEQVERYALAAEAELGPECEEPWVEACRRWLRRLPEEGQ